MDNQEYKKKLQGFNSTDKYREEMQKFAEMIDAKAEEVILDIGAGLGTMADYIRKTSGATVYAFDVTGEYYDGNKDYFTMNTGFFLEKKLNAVYFMHSFAHIENADRLVKRIADNFLKPDGRICILTPSFEWVQANRRPDYVPDPTVIKHYTAEELLEIVDSVGFTDIKIKIGERILLRAE